MPSGLGLDLPRHLYHFPLDALRHLLRVTGFEVESEHHFSLRQNPFGWIQSALNRCTSLPRSGLYTLLQRRGPSSDSPFASRTRWTLLSCLVIGAPLALLASLMATLARSGATVHLVARRRGGAALAQAPARAPEGSST